MNHDINVKKMRLNCFRQSKVPGEFMLQMRVPGGMVDAKYLSYVEHIANTWGDGNFHFGTRQTFDITGIKYENIPAVNAYLEQYIKEVDAELCGVNMDTVAHEPQPWDPKAGYPTIGARNITHVGLMLVVHMLAGLAGGVGGPAGILILVLGNAFVMGFEGLLVGIQVLRLEFYELFGRFYDDGGIPFVPKKIDYAARTNG